MGDTHDFNTTLSTGVTLESLSSDLKLLLQMRICTKLKKIECCQQKIVGSDHSKVEIDATVNGLGVTLDMKEDLEAALSGLLDPILRQICVALCQTRDHSICRKRQN